MDKRKKKYKSRGSVLVITALAAIVWIFIAQSLFIVTTSGFGMLKSSRVALQAQQYAEIEVDRLKNVAYENLDSDGAHSRQAIANIQESGWEDEVSIGSEHSISGSDNAKQRIATINVYKSGDTLPRFTLEVPLSSQVGDIDHPIESNKGYFRVGKTLVQYGREITSVQSAVTGKISFPITFNTVQSISITPVAAAPSTVDIGHNLHETRGSVAVLHHDNTGFDVLYGDDISGVYIHWIAIGY